MCWFFKKINKMNLPLSILIKNGGKEEKKNREQITDNRF